MWNLVNENGSTVILVVDVQKSLINNETYNGQLLMEGIIKLIDHGRTIGMEIIYVRHNNLDDADFCPQSEGWEIMDSIAPEEGEMIIDKWYNSAFCKTELDKYLQEHGIKNIILVGMQTEYCIDATCKSAFEHGYQVIIPKECNSTFDNEFLTGEMIYKFFVEKIWANRYADIVSIKDILQ